MIDFNDSYRMLIVGKLTDAVAYFEAINPATEHVIAQVPDADREQLEQAVEAARRAIPAKCTRSAMCATGWA